MKNNNNTITFTKFDNPNICAKYDAQIVSFSPYKSYKIDNNGDKEPLAIKVLNTCRYSKIKYPNKEITVGKKAVIVHEDGVIIIDVDSDKVL